MRKRWIQDASGKLINADEFRMDARSTSWQVMPDIKPYKSMIDGREITSRSRHREHLRDHNCVEVGNDSSLQRSRPPLQSPPGLKEKIIRAVNEVKERRRAT